MNSCNNFSKMEMVGNVDGPRKGRSQEHAWGLQCAEPLDWAQP